MEKSLATPKPAAKKSKALLMEVERLVDGMSCLVSMGISLI